MASGGTDIFQSDSVQQLICEAKDVNPSNIITYVAPADPILPPSYIVCLIDLNSLLEYGKQVLSLDEFKKFMKTKFYKKSCSIASSRDIPAKLYVKETGVLRETVHIVANPNILLHGGRIPFWMEQRKKLVKRISFFLNIMSNMNDTSEMSENDMQMFLNFVKDYNFEINQYKPDPLVKSLDDTPMEGFNLHKMINNIDSGNVKSSSLIKFQNSCFNKEVWLKSLTDQVLPIQRSYMEKVIFGCRSTDKSVNIIKSICAYQEPKSIELIFKDLTFNLYDKWSQVSHGVPNEYNNLWECETMK